MLIQCLVITFAHKLMKFDKELETKWYYVFIISGQHEKLWFWTISGFLIDVYGYGFLWVSH